MPIPDRTQAADYHYLAYSYPGDSGNHPWQLSPAVATRGNAQFYSLRRDLSGLVTEGNANHVPNIELQELGETINADGNSFRVLALSFGGVNVPNPRQILFTGGIHAREWIAPEMTYLLAEYLIKNYTTNPANRYQQTIHDLVNTHVIHIIPLLNPAGNWYSVFSPDNNSRMWRKNRRRLPTTPDTWAEALGNDFESQGGANAPFRNVVANLNDVTYDVPRYRVPQVDPLTYDNITIDLAQGQPQLIGVDCNRNFNTSNWGYETGADEEGLPRDEAYFGTDRASEKETRALINFVTNKTLHGAIDYHSYSQYILYSGEDTPPSAQDVNYGRALQTLIAPEVNPPWYASYNYQLGTVFGLLNYYAVSSVSDYMTLVKQCHAFTIELDPSSQNPGFLLPENQIMAVFEKNIRAALAFIASAGGNSVHVTAGTWKSRHTIISNHLAQFVNWDVFGRGNRLPV